MSSNFLKLEPVAKLAFCNYPVIIPERIIYVKKKPIRLFRTAVFKNGAVFFLTD
jgi:hypothetical protein